MRLCAPPLPDASLPTLTTTPTLLSTSPSPPADKNDASALARTAPAVCAARFSSLEGKGEGKGEGEDKERVRANGSTSTREKGGEWNEGRYVEMQEDEVGVDSVPPFGEQQHCAGLGLVNVPLPLPRANGLVTAASCSPDLDDDGFPSSSSFPSSNQAASSHKTSPPLVALENGLDGAAVEQAHDGFSPSQLFQQPPYPHAHVFAHPFPLYPPPPPPPNLYYGCPPPPQVFVVEGTTYFWPFVPVAGPPSQPQSQSQPRLQAHLQRTAAPSEFPSVGGLPPLPVPDREQPHLANSDNGDEEDEDEDDAVLAGSTPYDSVFARPVALLPRRRPQRASLVSTASTSPPRLAPLPPAPVQMQPHLQPLPWRAHPPPPSPRPSPLLTQLGMRGFVESRGRVRWFDAVKGYGFIEDAHSDELQFRDVFVHYTRIAQSKGYRCLAPGEEVEYTLVQEEEGGRLSALGVTGPEHSPVLGRKSPLVAATLSAHWSGRRPACASSPSSSFSSTVPSAAPPAPAAKKGPPPQPHKRAGGGWSRYRRPPLPQPSLRPGAGRAVEVR
ncbi:hypothetical protein JCM6882_003895 [Rhodosporidiobolus microsporus]